MGFTSGGDEATAEEVSSTAGGEDAISAVGLVGLGSSVSGAGGASVVCDAGGTSAFWGGGGGYSIVGASAIHAAVLRPFSWDTRDTCFLDLLQTPCLEG